MAKTVKRDDFLDFTFLSDLAYSPDGSRYGWLVHTFDLEGDGYHTDFYTGQAEGPVCIGRHVQSFCWLDAHTIVFPDVREDEDREYRARGGQVTGIYSLNIHTKKVEKLFALPLNVNEIKISREGYVLSATITLGRPNVERMPESEREMTLSVLQKEQDYLVFDEVPFWMNGKGFINKTRVSVFSCNRQGGGLTRLSPEKMEVMGYFVADAGVVFYGAEYETYRTARHLMYRCNPDASGLHVLIPDGTYSIRAACSWNGDIVVAASENRRWGASENPCFYRLTDSGMELIADPDLSVGCAVGTDCRYGAGNYFKADQNHLYFIATVGHGANLCAMDRQGKVAVCGGQGLVDCFDVFDGKIAAICMKGLRLEEVYEGTIHGLDRQVTAFNEAFYQDTIFSAPEHFSFMNSDGVGLDGWVMLPPGCDASKKYPAILNIHGGPKSVYGDVYYHEMQLWAAQGYIVFFCNPRGSDGKGNAFARIDGKFGTEDYQDFMEFTDAVLARYPCVDASRLGLTGGSYGGYLTNYIIGQTHRFKAAVSQRSVASWLTTIFTCDGGYHLAEDQFFGEDAGIWEEQSWKKLWEMSPIKYANNVKTPTLFIHSEFDFRTWIVEGIMMYSALVYHGVPAKMHVFKGENHNLSRSGRPSHRSRRLEEITAWFQQYL